MAAKKPSVKLSEQWQNGVFKCYRKKVGGRMFCLSVDRTESERKAMALVTVYGRLQAGGSGWTEEAVMEAMALAGGSHAGIDRAVIGSQRVHGAVDEYLADYRSKVSSSRYLRHVIALNDFKRNQPDVPLRMIGWDKLTATVEHYRARPVTMHDSPMAVATVATTLKAILAFYDWCDLTGRWESPRRFERLFRVKYQSLKTPLEMKRDGNGADVFTVGELKVLWASATPRQRLYIGLGLNIGETAQGLADLSKADIVRNGDSVVIDRHRGKTGVHGIYPLWSEVAALVESQVDGKQGEPLAFKTMDGKPLVWFHNTGRVDSISKTWNNLLNRCPKVRRMGFATLRKTGASMIRDLTGSIEVSQLYLSHKGGSVAEKHYLSRSFERLAAALVMMRNHLAPMFTTEPVVASQTPVAA